MRGSLKWEPMIDTRHLGSSGMRLIEKDTQGDQIRE